MQKKTAECLLAFLCIGAGFGISLWLSYMLFRPVAWIFLTLAICFLFWAVRTKITWIQQTVILLLSCFFALFAAELFLEMQNPSAKAVRRYNGSTKSPYVPDPLLGFAPIKQPLTLRTEKTLGSTSVYDVTHTTDEHGRRIVPQHPNAPTGVLFFGCSFTAGTGVNDEESYPYQVAKLLGDKYQVYNFGVGGYGPHQFLALLESDRLAPIVKAHKELRIFFMSIEFHEWRSAGMVEWDTDGPKYITENNQAVRQGNFTLSSEFLQHLWKLTKKNNLWSSVLLRDLQWRKEEMLQLQDAILRTAQRLSVEKYHAPFTLILTPEISPRAKQYRAEGITVLDVSSSLPDWPGKGTTIANDGHPTGLAHENMAKSIADFIQKQAPLP